jgi:hypothetical protein
MPSTTYQRKKTIDVSWAGDRAVLYDRDSRSALTLNPTASVLWTHLEDPQNIDQLVGYLLENFDGISAEQATADVQHFLGELKEKNLIL